jgi:MFS transporter, SP family, sugar:H+ symporter
VTPYIVDKDKGNLRSKVFFVWGSTCCLCLLFAYFCVPETKGLSLEQVDHMLEETNPRTSAKWVPHSTYAQEMGLMTKGPGGTDHQAEATHVEKHEESEGVGRV